MQKARSLTNNPGPGMMVLPNEKIAKKYSRKRWRPFIDISPALAAIKPANRDAYSLLEQHFTTASMILVGSNSAANLSSEPIKYLWLDEVDKYPLESEREGDSVALAKKRLRSFDDSKGVDSSTPSLESGQIWQSLKRSDWRRFFCPCPRCAEYFYPQWSDFWWPAEAKLDEGEYDLDLVLSATRLICPECDGEIENHEKIQMGQAGEWRPTQKGEPGHIGFHFPAFMVQWESCDWGRLAVEFLQAKSNPGKLRDVVNSTWAEAWEIRGQAADADEILNHQIDYAPQTCPVVPLRCFMTVDKQHDCYWYVVRAWCRRETSYLLEFGMVESLADLDEIAARKYRAQTFTFAIDRVFMDSGDDTIKVYAICRRRRWKPTKGERSMGGVEPLRLGKGKDGTSVLLFQASKFKTALQDRIAMPLDQPGAWYLPRGTSREYARQVAGEERLELIDRYGHEREQWKKTYANHLLDCEVLQLVAAEAGGVRKLQQRLDAPGVAPDPERKRPAHRVKRRAEFGRGRR